VGRPDIAAEEAGHTFVAVGALVAVAGLDHAVTAAAASSCLAVVGSSCRLVVVGTSWVVAGSWLEGFAPVVGKACCDWREDGVSFGRRV